MKRFDLNILYFCLLDLGFIYYSFIFTNLLIHNFNLVEIELVTTIQSFYWLLPIYFLCFYLFKMYSNLWKYASVEEAVKVLFAIVVSFGIISGIILLFSVDIPMNQMILNQLILLLMLMGLRYSYRVVKAYSLNNKQKMQKNTLIIGAGSAGSLLARTIKLNYTLNHKIIGFIDDDAKKLGKKINGIKVLGTTNSLAYFVKNYHVEEIIVAIPSANERSFKRILGLCENTLAKTKVFPPFYQEFDQEFNYQNIRDVHLEDLLGRKEIKIDQDGLSEFLKDEVILVTGGGGSIGSEICRHVMKYHPKQLIIFDVYENNAYEIQNELKEVEVQIGSIQDQDRLEELFRIFTPTIVFHAAAHKHVPLMEDNPKEAIKNNVFGTYNLIKFADLYHVKKFVFISSDKAVNPTSIMGASKRLCEMMIDAFNQDSMTQYSAVRFGNVLGSNGSVIPLFKKQIEQGGPVTVTHKDIIRYFMTIPEAVSLVLEAGSCTLGGEIFVLNMGEPIKILQLAENLIRFSGFEPYKDIDIKITGLRKGEKLYEELLMKEEGLKETSNDEIFVLNQQKVDTSIILEYLEELKYLISMRNQDVKEVFQRIVPTYKYSFRNEVNL